MIERWKPIPDYEDLYQVSDRGRVRRIAGGKGTYVGHILRPRDNNCGYPCVMLYKNKHRKLRTVHTLVTEAFLGPRPAGLQVNHKNGIKEDNRIGNLEYVTQSENIRHSFRVLGRKRSGGVSRGETNGQAKLTATDVRAVRRLYVEGGVTQYELAERYGVSQYAIWCVLRRKRWIHVS